MMNRRRFLELLGLAAAGSAVIYSFPSIIVPKNLAEVGPVEVEVVSPIPIYPTQYYIQADISYRVSVAQREYVEGLLRQRQQIDDMVVGFWQRDEPDFLTRAARIFK